MTGNAGSLAARLCKAPKPADLRAARSRLGDLLEDDEKLATLAHQPPVRDLLLGIADHSTFLWRLMRRVPARLSGFLEQAPEHAFQQILSDMSGACDTADNEEQVMQCLRMAKQSAALLIALADLGGVWDVVAVTQALSQFADAAVSGALRYLLRAAANDGKLVLRDAQDPETGCGVVVLALGNLPGEYPIRQPLPFYHSQRYVHVPWRPGVLAGIPPESEVLIVGAGLTAVDFVLELQSAGHRGIVHALSRRGLLPQVHRPAPAYPAFLAGENPPATMLGLFRRIRAEVRTASAAGIDWRPVLDAIRGQTPAIWAGLSWTERARFMRHVRPYWEGHRHRIAPVVAGKIEALRTAGRLRFYAGRLEKLVERPEGVEARFRLRGKSQRQNVTVAKVINCTGPRSDYSKYQHPLLINLLASGLIDHDPLALGINATAAGEVLAHRGGPVGWLYTLGAPLKGVLWECTAVPEIRNQASALATRLLAS